MSENVEPNKEEEVPPEEQQTDLAGLLSVFPNSPVPEQIELWKQKHGEVFCSAFSEKELFVWRPLSRQEHVNLQKRLHTPKQGEEPLNELDYEQLVVEACLLWSSVLDLSKKAGSLTTLSEQILLNSNFINPQMASAFTIKL